MHLSPAPRNLPLAIKILAIFGGFLSQFGWAFFGFGMIFFWIFTAEALILDFKLRGPLERTQAVLTEVYETSATENKRRIIAHEYQFQVKGHPYAGISYLTGDRLESGSQVPIEYRSDEPEISVIRLPNFRPATFSLGVGLIVFIFPLVGLVFIFLGLKKGLYYLQLLSSGELTSGILHSKKSTGARINKLPVYKLTFKFKVQGKSYFCSANTHLPQFLEDEAEEWLFYAPQNPERAVMKDLIPGRIHIDQTGQIQVHQAQKSFAFLALPTLAILLNLLFALVYLL